MLQLILGWKLTNALAYTWLEVNKRSSLASSEKVRQHWNLFGGCDDRLELDLGFVVHQEPDVFDVLVGGAMVICRGRLGRVKLGRSHVCRAS